MRRFFTRLWNTVKGLLKIQNDPFWENSFGARILNALTLIIVITCLGLWITAFLLLKDQLFSKTLTGTILTDLTCITFFGGLAIAIVVGGAAGNFLRRTFWKMIDRRKKR
jgi:hypothetical protein